MAEQNSRVVIVTGGTYGIGRGITLRLARDGWRVAAVGLDAQQMGSAAQDGSSATRAVLEAEGLDALLLEADVADETAVTQMVATVANRYGRIDALVNNAAIHPRGDVVETAVDVWDRVLAVNLRGPFLCARAVIPHLRTAGGGRIVNIGSGAAWGKPRLAAYAASKGGLHALTMALAKDHLADRIAVNMVIPGGVRSGMVEADPIPDFDRIASQTASGEVTRPDDIAAAVAFLLSDEARQVSGTVLDVGCFAGQGSMPP